ncbi:Melanoma-associated antigen 10, partial [Orchesella cincta]
NKFTAVFLCFLFAVFPLLYTLSGFQVIPSSVLWNPSLMFRCLVVEGRFAFFLNVTSREPCNDNNPPALDELCLIDLIVGVLAFLMETARQVLGFYSDFFPLICCLSLWTSVGALQEYLEIEDNDYIHQHQHKHFHSPKVEEQRTSCNGNGRIMLPYIFPSSSVITSSTPTTSTPLPLPSTDEASSCQKEKIESSHSGFQSSLDSSEVGNILLERYEVCKAFSRTVNRALGQLLFAYVLSSIMYLSTCMDAVLVLQDWFGKLRVAFFFFVFILMFFIGSEIVNKVYGLRVWLSTPTNNAFLSERNLLVLIQELTCKSIGVSGNGMFTITYSTFMTVMTTTVTFFIIILQFQKPDREELSATLRTFMIHFANRTQLLDV